MAKKDEAKINAFVEDYRKSGLVGAYAYRKALEDGVAGKVGGRALPAGYDKIPANESLRTWFGEKNKPTTGGSSKVASSLQAEFEQALAQEETREQKFLKFLKEKQKSLQAELAEVEREIAKRETATA